MQKLKEIPDASVEYLCEQELFTDSAQLQLALDLERAGHKTIAVGRGLVTIERCENADIFPQGAASDPLRISIYPDIDVYPDRNPAHLILHIGRFGLDQVFLLIGGRVFRLKEERIKDDSE